MAVTNKFPSGINLAPLVSIERNWTRENGWSSVSTFTGPWSVIDELRNNSSVVGGASNISVSKDKNLGTLRVSFQNDDNSTPDEFEEQSNTWTFTPYENQRDLALAPKYYPARKYEEGFLDRVEQAVEQYRSDIKTAIAAQATEKDDPFYLFTTDALGASQTKGKLTRPSATKNGITGALAASRAEEYARMLLEGFDSYDTSRYTLRNQIVVPAGTSVTVSHLGTGYQWTNDQVVNVVASGNAPLAQRTIIGDLTTYFGGTYWLKKAPTIQQINNGKFEISTEYVNYQAYELPTEINPVYVP